MAATVTLNKALEIVSHLRAADREKLFRELREQRRKVWLAKVEAEAEKAMKEHRAGKLRHLSSPKEIRAFCDEIFNSDDV